MYSISCYMEPLNFENTLYIVNIPTPTSKPNGF
jgi:hypothetical protein